MKKLLALMTALLILMMCTMPAYALDIESLYPYISEIEVQPGNPRADKPEYRFSWLDNVVIRYDANSLTPAVVTPRPSDYPYSETFEEFSEEVSAYSMLFEIDEFTVAEVYEELTTVLYYTFTAMGFTDTQEVMRAYLVENGISLPLNETAGDKAKIAIVYAAHKYNAVYVLYEKEVVLPTGISLDEATVVILSALTGTMLPSGIDTLSGLALLVTRNYVTGFEQLPVSDNPGASEVFYWAKVITAAQNNYQVPLEPFDKTTTAQREYVDYAYHASILNTVYDINVDPIRLVTVLQSEEEDALQKFILQTMLEEKKVAYSQNATASELFDLACQNGFFDLEQEFYTDIFYYELRVPTTCEKVWFTPFSLAGQLQGSDAQYVTVFLNGTEMSAGSTVSTPLDAEKTEQSIELRVVYDDKINTQSETVYTYKVIRDASLNMDGPGFAEGDLVGGVQQLVDGIVPNENVAASQKVDSIFDSIGGALTTTAPAFTTDALTTYGDADSSVGGLLEGYNITTEGASDYSTTTSEGERFDSGYLGELIGDVYATDANGNIITTVGLSSLVTEDGEQTVVDKLTETVKESPEVVAVPSSLLAAFSVAGYLMNRKHREAAGYRNEEEDE